MGQRKPTFKEYLQNLAWWEWLFIILPSSVGFVASLITIYLVVQQPAVPQYIPPSANASGGIPPAAFISGILVAWFIVSSTYYTRRLSRDLNNYLPLIAAGFFNLLVLYAYIQFWSVYWLGPNWWIVPLLLIVAALDYWITYALRLFDSLIREHHPPEPEAEPVGISLDALTYVPTPIVINPYPSNSYSPSPQTTARRTNAAILSVSLFIVLGCVIIILLSNNTLQGNAAPDSQGQYYAIDLGAAGAYEHPEYLQRYPKWPRGIIYLGPDNVPFDFGDRAATLETQFEYPLPGSRSLPADVTIPIHIERPLKVYLLMNTSYDCLPSTPEDVGTLVFNFDKSLPITVRLQADYNIREWAVDAAECKLNGLTPHIIAANVKPEVWQDINTDGGKRWVMDMFTFAVPSDHLDQRLVSIEIHDTSLAGGNVRPAIQVFAITVKTQSPATSK